MGTMSLVMNAYAATYGAMKLDNVTFDKMVAAPGFNLLAKFDTSYAHGEKEDAFKELCKLARPVKNLLIGEIGVQDYGDMDNEDLAKRFEVKADDFPAFVLFKGSAEAAIRFKGFPDPLAKRPSNWDEEEDGEWEAPMREDVTAENLAIWLRQHGVKISSGGTIAELDEQAEQFMKGSKSTRTATVASTKLLVEQDYKEDKTAQLYPKIMEKILEKGADYIENESVRVKRIMEGKITPEKMEELGGKVKILNVFAELMKDASH